MHVKRWSRTCRRNNDCRLKGKTTKT